MIWVDVLIECETVSTPEECEQIAVSIGKPYNGYNTIEQFPAGCVAARGYWIYWNEVPPGKYHREATPVCKEN